MSVRGLPDAPPEPKSGAGRISTPLEEAFDRLSGVLYRYVLVRVGGDSHLADDIMQTTWMQACRHAGDVPDEALEFWLRRVAANLICSHWRRIGRRPGHVPLPDGQQGAAIVEELSSPSASAADLAAGESREQLLLALTSLAAEEQTLLVEHYFHGKSHAQLSEELALSARAVEGRLYRARAALRERLVRPDALDEDALREFGTRNSLQVRI